MAQIASCLVEEKNCIDANVHTVVLLGKQNDDDDDERTERTAVVLLLIRSRRS